MLALGFLILSTGFVVTLLMALWKMITKDWENQELTAMSVLNLFKWPILFFLLFLLFIIFGVPYLEGLSE